MQIVIDIPEDLKKMIFDDEVFDIAHSYRLAMCVKNGTPLPEAEDHGFIAVCNGLNAVTQEVVDKLKNTVFIGDEDCSYCFDIMEIIEADGGDAE